MSQALGSVLDDGIVGPYMGMYFMKITHWEWAHKLAFACLLTFFVEVCMRVWSVVGQRLERIPYNPKLHLNEFSVKDRIFIFINKISIVVYTYHMFMLLTLTEAVKWKVEEATFFNTVVVLIPMFLIFDFFYSLVHKVLHMRCIYGYIHKHHHRQISPSRGHWDAINVHPVEFLIGEYIHLIALWAVPCHIFAAFIFMIAAMVIATSNHDRLDICVPGIFDSKDHLVHHRLPDTNFGQYTMFWDKLWGWHRFWDESLGKAA